MHNSVNDSLKKLRTDYIDILYVHWWDYTCTVEEVMDGLHTLVLQGKVLYLGISDSPAWIVSRANSYARMSGKTPFVIYQGLWNIMQRDFERDILPMAISEGKRQFIPGGINQSLTCYPLGMALAPWNVLAGGKIRTDAEEQKRLESGEHGRALRDDWQRTPEERKVCLELERIAKEIGVQNITAGRSTFLIRINAQTLNITLQLPLLGSCTRHLTCSLLSGDARLSILTRISKRYRSP